METENNSSPTKKARAKTTAAGAAANAKKSKQSGKGKKKKAGDDGEDSEFEPSGCDDVSDGKSLNLLTICVLCQPSIHT